MAFRTDTLTSDLLQVFPKARERWNAHLDYWGGEEDRGLYNDIAVFAHYIVDSYRESQTEEFEAGFSLIEDMITEGPADVRKLMMIGLLEDVQNISSHDGWGYQDFERWMGPNSKAAWQEVARMWEGKHSLADVLRAEREGSK